MAPAHPPELLAPAGDWSCVRAAVANGADALYFGLPRFNARRRATNFSLQELPEVVQFLHQRNVRGYVTVNTLVFCEELDQAADYVAAIAQAGADAVIVQDLGLVRLIRRLAPTLPIQASTQMTLTEPAAIEAVRALGVERVILARELSLAEIRRIAETTSAQLEVFVHGALCLSYSGQCLASESLFGRSGNRGQCAQPCRLPYDLIVDGRARRLGRKRYLLSPRDLAAHELIGELVKLGIAGFKIEGRLKNAAYVAAATRVYRAAIDAALAGRRFAPTREQQEALTQSFSRGFTCGYLKGADHQALVAGDFPRSRGRLIGAVLGKTRHGIIVQLDAADSSTPKPGDGLAFDAARPDQQEQGARVYAVRPYAPPGAAGPSAARPATGNLVELTFGRGDLNPAAVADGSLVWKTDDPRLRRELEKTFSRVEPFRRAPLKLTVRAATGAPLTVIAEDDAGHRAEVASAQPLEAARKHPLTLELLREQFARLGETGFALDAVELIGPEGPAPSVAVMAAKSVLNDLRRRAVEALSQVRAAATRHVVAEPEALARLRAENARAWPAQSEAAQPQLCVLARTPEQFQAALAWTPPPGRPRPALLYADFRDVRRNVEAVRSGRAAGLPVGLATPRILKPGEEALLENLLACRPDVVLVRNLGGLRLVSRAAPRMPTVADFSLNVSNDLAAAILVELGAGRIVPAYDLNFAQLESLLGHVPPALLEVVIHQRLPLFHTEHCLLAARLSRGANRHDCGRPCAKHTVRLRDRNGEELPLAADSACRNTIFSSTAQWAAGYLGQLLKLGVRYFRIEFLDESPAQATALLDIYCRLLDGQLRPAEAERLVAAATACRVTAGTFEWE